MCLFSFFFFFPAGANLSASWSQSTRKYKMQGRQRRDGGKEDGGMTESVCAGDRDGQRGDGGREGKVNEKSLTTALQKQSRGTLNKRNEVPEKET